MIAAPAQALPTRWNLLVIPVDFSDEPGYVPAGAETTIVEGLNNFFYQQSNYTFDQLHVTWVPQVMRLAHPRRRYNFCNVDALPAGETCLNMWNSESGLPTQLAKNAGYIDQIGAGLVPPGGGAPDVFDQIMFIQAVSTMPDCTYNYPLMPGHSFGGKSVSADGSSRHRYVVGYVALGQHSDCVVDDHDFGPLAHEVGHGMADIYPHPTCYQSAFNMMDSGYGDGYPSAIGVFDRMDESFLRPGDNRWFNGWLPASNVTSLSPPESSTEVLSPLEWDAADAVSPQGLKVDTGRGYYYLVECRRLQFPDDRIASEGTLIVRSPPAGGDPCNQSNWLMTAPGYYEGGGPDPALLHFRSIFSPGDEFVDDVAHLTIHVEADSGEGCAVTVAYGEGSTDTVPDLGIIPWRTPPQNTWETTDLWIDSSINGYVEDDPLDSSRLQYGRWADGTAIGNGDDPCIAHENRVYARIRNFGTGVSTPTIAHLERTNPLGVGIRDSSGWVSIGDVLVEGIAPGGFADVYVPWVPDTLPGDEGDHFALHSCIRVRVDAVAGEIVLTNQDGDREQENIEYFQVRRDPLSLTYGPASGEIFLANTENVAREFDIGINTELPDAWSLTVGDGSDSYLLAPGEVRHIPVTIEVPFGEPLGQGYDVRVRAFTTESPPAGIVTGNLESRLVSALTLRASTVEEVSIGLDAVVSGSTILVTGCLSAWLANQSLTIDYLTPNGLEIPQLVTTDAAGCFQGAYYQGYTGLWGVRAIWAGNTSYSRAVSDQLTVGVETTLSNCCTVPLVSTPGCEYPSVESCVCAVDSYCCNTNWDSICVGEVSSLGCGTCRDACTSGSDPGAFEQSTETCVCSADTYCCTTAWDSICVSEVSSFGCGICLAGFAGPAGGGGVSMSTSSMSTARRARPLSSSASSTQPVSR